MKKSLQRKYARLIVRTGVNLQKGQGCIISVEVDQYEFARLVEEEAYKAGAKWVTMNWIDQPSTKLKYENESLKQLSKVEKWEEKRQQYFVDTLPAMIHIVSADPDGLKGVDVEKMQTASMERIKALKKYRDAMDDLNQWVIAAVPSKEWAKKVFPKLDSEKAYKKLWKAILMTVRVDKDNDPVKAWQKHNKKLLEKCKTLNKYKFDYLHYESKSGTDFKCWLIPQSRWMGGPDALKNDRGILYNPNMPTEEVFTSPMKGKCEGTLVSTMPLSYQGNLIEDFSVTFKKGKVVSCKAKKGQELLERMIGMDEGAAMLGELALVPDDSPISNSGILFYNTLFDENASCHVALGRGFDSCIKGYEDKSKDELREMGLNDSMIHVDFMVGSKDLNITGYTKDGKAVKVFKNGNWSI